MLKFETRFLSVRFSIGVPTPKGVSEPKLDITSFEDTIFYQHKRETRHPKAPPVEPHVFDHGHPYPTWHVMFGQAGGTAATPKIFGRIWQDVFLDVWKMLDDFLMVFP